MAVIGFAVMSQFEVAHAAVEICVVNDVVSEQKKQGSIDGGFVDERVGDLFKNLFPGHRAVCLE